MKNILYFLATILPFGVLDALWIGLIAKNFYAKTMSGIFSQSMLITPALFFYPIYALAVFLLVVLPAVSSGIWTEALWRGALLGLAAYSAYDLTNQATLSGWPIKMTVIDIGWGVLVTSLSSIIAFFIITAIK